MLRNLLLLTFITVVGMLVLAYATTDTTQREEPSAAVVIDLFDRLALAGFGEGGPKGQGPYLRRWTQPVHIAVIGAPEAAPGEASWTEGVEAMAGVYDVLPNLDLSVVGDAPFATEGEAAEDIADLRGAANLTIWTVPEDAVRDFAAAVGLPSQAAAELEAPRGGCTIAGAEAAVLSQVTIAMRADLSQGKRRTCLGEQLPMALGFHIPEKILPDVFRTRQGTIAFHPLGRMAAALVYDEALEPGMPRADALDAATAVVKSKGLE